MKRKRYSVEQIVSAVKQHELGTPVVDIVRMLGIASRHFTAGRSSTVAWSRTRFGS